MLVNLLSAAIQGIEAYLIRIEVSLSRGIRFSLVGLPDSAVKESHERIVSALRTNHMDLPRHQITINMAPAAIRNEGTSFDLPLAVALMAAGEYVPASALDNTLFIGELSLDGSLQPVKGILPIAIMAVEKGINRLILPEANVLEASIVDNITLYGLHNLSEVASVLKGEGSLKPFERTAGEKSVINETASVDLADIKGQEAVKRALEIACAGGHNLLLIGPPGSGKTMLSKAIPGILPSMTLQESLETTKIYSVAGKTSSTQSLIQQRPFRAPHHSLSDIALIGGGTKPQPGEISLAHNGVLYLDELPEFKRHVLETLRQPLEDKTIRIARSQYAIEYPASFMLVASMNPCPCGYYNDPATHCVCSPGEIQRYVHKLSGPLLDRIDIQVEVLPVSFEQLCQTRQAESSQRVRERITEARYRQQCRLATDKKTTASCNACLSSTEFRKYTPLDSACLQLLEQAMKRFHLSARAFDRILKVCRTIADLEGSDTIKTAHLAEAMQYRTLDKSKWGQ
jgi:magnesium chelatase family protein